MSTPDLNSTVADIQQQPATPTHNSDDLTFHLGITMAGAVSAGAYTAGVICQLMEMLDAWEEKKQENRKAIQEYGSRQAAVEAGRFDESIPMHNVVIDVLGGASAGAIAAVLTALTFRYQTDKIEMASAPNRKNILFDAWVNLNDPAESDSKVKTVEQMLSNTDLKESNIFLSLLQSKPLELAARRIINRLEDSTEASQSDRIPLRAEKLPYVSPQLDLIISITSLRGAEAQIFFSKKRTENGDEIAPAHVMKIHRGVVHYAMNMLEKDRLLFRDDKIPRDLRYGRHIEMMVESALASGAFPIGLSPRQLEIPKWYLEKQLAKRFGNELYPKHLTFPDVRGKDSEGDLFSTSAVDGGTMNNEPFTEVSGELDIKTGKAVDDAPDREHRKAVILIDPFPNFDYNVYERDNPRPVYKHPRNIGQATRQLIGAMLSQARIKDKGMLDQMLGASTYGMIFPHIRNSPYNGEALATGGFEGFAGFLHRKLRVHDFLLGRRNCQSFLRYYFGEIEEYARGKPNQLFHDWNDHDPRYLRFAHKVEGKMTIPLIPDVTIRNREDYNNAGLRRKYPAPELATLSLRDIKKLKRPVIKRLLRSFLTVFSFNKPAKPYEPYQVWSMKIPRLIWGDLIFGILCLALILAGLCGIVVALMPALGEVWLVLLFIGVLLGVFALCLLLFAVHRLAAIILNAVARDMRSRNQLKK